MEPEIFYFHGVTAESFERNFTLAGMFTQDTVVKRLVLGIALCSDHDQFCKKKGRLVATNRVLNQKDECPGRIYLTIDDHTAAMFGYPVPSDDNTLKTFVHIAQMYQDEFKNDLMKLFGLDNNNKKV